MGHGPTACRATRKRLDGSPSAQQLASKTIPKRVEDALFCAGPRPYSSYNRMLWIEAGVRSTAYPPGC